MKVDLVVKNARLVSPRGIVEGGVGVEGGVIVAISRDPNLPQADKIIDAKGMYVLPGLLDGHAHTYLAPETPSSGTKAALKGGVTTILEMPGTQMGCFNPGEYLKKRDIYADSSHVDFSLHAGCASGYPEGNLTSLWGMGATGIKFFVSSAGPKWPQTFDGEIIERFKEIARVDGLALVHAENEFILRDNLRKLQADGRRDFSAHLEWRPPICEIEAGKRMITYMKETMCRGMLVHTSLPEVVYDTVKAKSNGVKILVETCPQYLYLTEDDVKINGPWMKFAPPARSKEAKAMMRKLLAEGWIDTVATDHAPYSKESKNDGLTDIFSAPNGIPGIENFACLMLNAVNEGWISLERVAEVMSERPACIYGVYPRKGTLSIGSDADFIIVDMNKETQIRNDDQITACGWTPYDGMRVKGMPIISVLRGKVAMQDGLVTVKKGYGEYISRL